jgi:serine phosphatase RsbU (regulator of sigma subunit)/anti-sigma regulatory factor (Ser/Thr protein kinase)
MDPLPGLYPLGVVLVFVALAVARWSLRRGRHTAPWHAYAFAALEAAVLAYVLLAPNPLATVSYPLQVGLRFGTFTMFFVLPSLAALTYSPRLVVFTGVSLAIFWSIGVLWIVEMPNSQPHFGHRLSSMLADATLLDIHLDPRYVDINQWAQQIIALFIVTGVMAVGVHRSRRLVFSQVAATQERANLKRIEEERDTAKRMQRSILPKRLPVRPDIGLLARMITAREVGGDFYDVIELDEDRIGIVIADVSGKGVPAALFMAVSCTVIKSVAARAGTPGEVLAEINDILCDGNDAAMFVTVFYGIMNSRTGAFTYANAGHNPPYLMRPSGAIEPLALTNGVALGVMDGLPYAERSIELGHGDTVFCYTDGVTEAFDVAGGEFSDARLEEALHDSHGLEVEALGVNVIDRVRAFAGAAPQSDDITCLVIRYRAAAAPVEEAMRVDTDEMVVRIANDLPELERLAGIGEAFFARNGLPAKFAFSVNLALDELVTNTVSYGYDRADRRTIEVRIKHDGDIVSIEVEDDAKAYNPLEAPEPDLDASVEDRPIGGLGVHFVKSIMDTVNYRRVDNTNQLAMTMRVQQEGTETDGA